jgi:hypothetical protein
MIEEEILQELSHQLNKKFNIDENQTKLFLLDFFSKKSLIFSPKKTKEDFKKIGKELGIEIPKNCSKFETRLLIEKKKKEIFDLESRIKISSPEKKIKEKNKEDFLVGLNFVSAQKNCWSFGNLIGKGGFGAIYQEKSHPDLVIKTGKQNVDKNKSGIFFEKTVLLKLKDDSDSFGIPQLIDSGKLPANIKDDYFIVIPKFQDSLENIMKNKKLSFYEINQIMIQILNSLSYMNSKGYIHLDIKPENIMKKDKKWYLIDFGIASNFKDETKNDPSKAGNGTLWFMSRDAHRGQMSRKCDLESVVFVLALLDGETLDWQVKLNKTEENKKLILEKKNEFFENLDKRLLIPIQHKNFMKSVDRFIPGTNPDYKNFQSMFY